MRWLKGGQPEADLDTHDDLDNRSQDTWYVILAILRGGV